MAKWQDRLIELKGQGKTYQEIADALNAEHYPGERFSKDRVRGWWRRHEDGPSVDPYSESFEWRADGTGVSDKLITIMAGEKITPQLIMERHGLDAGEWQVVSYRNNLWHGQVKGGARTILYQSRLTVRPSGGISLEHIDEFFNRLAREYKPVPICPIKTAGPPCMVEVNIADLHLGKLAWAGNTGNNYDHRIAANLMQDITASFCNDLAGKNIEQILFVWANDFFNADTVEQTTVKGTPQDVDCRWEKMYDTGCEALITAIDMLSQLAPVTTFYTPSNHDQMTGYHALGVLNAWYRDSDRVTIVRSSRPRYYHRYGNILLGYCHGDTEGRESKSYEKASRLASLMPNEAAELWGQTKYREMHAAHLHSEQTTNEINGVTVRRITSPTAIDNYHAQAAYVGTVRRAQAFVYDKEYGLVQSLYKPVM